MSCLLWSVTIFIILKTNEGNTQESVIRTSGCIIPDYNITFQDSYPRVSCGVRDVFIRKVSDDKIQFTMKRVYESCCYRYLQRSDIKFMEDLEVSYSVCVTFKDQENVTLSKDFINVRCTSKGSIVYNDYYAFIKPIEYTREEQKRAEEDESENVEERDNNTAQMFNVLVLGMTAMSRKRAYNSLNETVSFLKQNNWLDFRGFNKIESSSLLKMAILSGKGKSLIANSTCMMDLSACNGMLIWSHFQEKGYVTAYGEDLIHLNITFSQISSNGFSTPPTDHYMTPLFLAAERKNGASMCTERILSAMQVLNYILGCALTYKDKRNLFGFFWINSFSNDLEQSPKQFDSALIYFFKKLKDSGILKNTFVIFMGDHGIKFGPVRHSAESYHDERLPMLFVSVPDEFKKSYRFYNLEANQQRLISPFDLYLTLWDILKISTNEIIVPRAEACPRCMSLFHSLPEHRTCSDAGIDEEWCTCHGMNTTTLEDYGAMYSLVHAISYLNNQSSTIETQPCTSCRKMDFKKLLRINTFSYNETKYYIAAFVMDPDEVKYEVTVRKHVNHTFNSYVYDILGFQLISKHNGKGFCTKNKNDEHMCICQYNSICTPISK